MKPQQSRNFESNLADTHQKFMELKLNFNAENFRNLFPNLQVANTNDKKYVNLQILPEFKIIVVENLNAGKKAIRALEFESNDDMLQIDIQFDSDKNDSQKNRQKILMVSVGCEQKFCIIFRACKFGFKIPQILLNFLRTSGKKILVFKHYQKIKNIFEYNNIDCNNILYYRTLMKSLGYNGGGATKFEEKFLGVKLNTNSETYNFSKVQKNFAALKVFVLGGIVRCLKHSFTKIIKCSKCNLCLGTQFSECEKFSTNYCDLCWRESYEKQEQISQISENTLFRQNFGFGLLEKSFFPFLMDLNFISFSTTKKRVTQINIKSKSYSHLESWEPSKKTIKKLQFNDIQKQTYEFCSGYIVEEGEQGEQDKIIPLKNYVPQQEKQNYYQNSNQKATNFHSQQKNTTPNNSAKKSRKQKKNPQIKSFHKIGSLQQLINQAIQKKQQSKEEQKTLNQSLESTSSTGQQENILQQNELTPENISQPKEKIVQTKQTQQKRKKVKKLQNQFQQSFLEVVKQSLGKSKDGKVWERKGTQQTSKQLTNVSQKPQKEKKPSNQLKEQKPSNTFQKPQKEKKPSNTFQKPQKEKQSPDQFQKPQKEKKSPNPFQKPQKEKKPSNQFQKPQKAKKPSNTFQKPQKEKKPSNSFQKPQKEKKSPNPFQKPQKENKSPSQFQKPQKEKKSQSKNTKKDTKNTESKNLQNNQKETTSNKKKYLLLSLKDAPLGKISTKSIFQ